MVRADNMLVYGSMKQIEQRIIGLLKEYGKDTVMAALDELIDRARAAVKAVISKYPAGTYYAERAADWDGTTDKPVWVRLAMTVKPKEGKVIFDFSESDPQCDFINVPLGQVWSSVTAGFLWCLPPGLPRNKGFFDCMEVITKEGTCLSPVYPATAASQAVTLGLEITECVMLAMAQVDPKESPATWGRHVNPLYAENGAIRSIRGPAPSWNTRRTASTPLHRAVRRWGLTLSTATVQARWAAPWSGRPSRSRNG